MAHGLTGHVFGKFLTGVIQFIRLLVDLYCHLHLNAILYNAAIRSISTKYNILFDYLNISATEYSKPISQTNCSRRAMMDGCGKMQQPGT